MALSTVILIVACTNSIMCTEHETLVWNPGTRVQVHINVSTHEKVTLQLGRRAVALMQVHGYQEQIIRSIKYLDFGPLNLIMHNVQMHVDKYNSNHLEMLDNFFSRPHFKNEFLFHYKVKESECKIICTAHHTSMVADSDTLNELISLTPRFGDPSWVQVENSATIRNNIALHTVKFGNITLIKNNKLVHHDTQVFAQTGLTFFLVQHLKGQQNYFDAQAHAEGKRSYYRSQPLQLTAKLAYFDPFHPDTPKFQFQILTPIEEHLQTSTFGTARCICARKMTKNRQAAVAARQIAFQTRVAIGDQGAIELARLQNVPANRESLDEILAGQQEKFMRLELLKTASLKMLHFTDADSLNAPLPIVTKRSTVARMMKRSLPITPLGLFGKAAFLTLPKLLTHFSHDQLTTFARNIGAKLVNPDPDQHNFWAFQHIETE